MPVVVVVITALVVAAGSGARVRNGVDVPTGRFAVVLVLFFVQAVARGRLVSVMPASGYGRFVWVCVCVLLAVVLWFGHGTAGARCMALGFLMNTGIVLLNHGMPVTTMYASGTGVADSIANSAGFYAAVNQGHIWVALADVMPVRLLGSTWMLSAGDVLVMVGAVVSFVCVTTEQESLVALRQEPAVSSFDYRAPLAHESRHLEE